MKKCYIVGAGDFYGSIHPCEDDMVIAADGGVIHLLSLGIVPDVIVGDFDSLAESLVNGDCYSKEPYRVKNNAKKLGCDVSSDAMKEKTGFAEELIGEVVCRVKNCEDREREIDFFTMGGKDVEIHRHPVMKDETDMYLAYEIGTQKGYRNFELYGGVGGREDHTFANYCLLLKAKNDKNDMILVGNGTKIFVVKNEKIKVSGRVGATVSVFAFGERADGVSVRGLKYEAENISLDISMPLGVSNSFLSSGEGEISVDSGALLVVVYD